MTGLRVEHYGPETRSVQHMPRPGPRRPIVALRLSDSGISRIDALAAEAGVTRSEMLRRLLAYGVWKMPKGWKP